jgi:hypothetical protein
MEQSRKSKDENEKYARKEEINFLEKMRKISPNEIEVTIFQFEKWDENGKPIGKTIIGWIPLQDILNQSISALEKANQTFSTVKEYNKTMVNQKMQKNWLISKILKLELKDQTWPINVIKI